MVVKKTKAVSKTMNKTQTKSVIKSFMGGEKIADIAKSVGKSTQIVKTAIDTYKITMTELGNFVPQNQELMKLQREQVKIYEAKDRALDFIMEALETTEGMTKNDMMRVIDKVGKTLATCDGVSRLNQNRPTAIAENRNTNIEIDVAATLKELDTPEKKRAFLLRDFKNVI